MKGRYDGVGEVDQMKGLDNHKGKVRVISPLSRSKNIPFPQTSGARISMGRLSKRQGFISPSPLFIRSDGRGVRVAFPPATA